jgi:hypothetical protein
MFTKTVNPYNHKFAEALALGVLVLAVNQAHAANYSFSDLGTISGPYVGMTFSGINNQGQVIGGDGGTRAGRDMYPVLNVSILHDG